MSKIVVLLTSILKTILVSSPKNNNYTKQIATINQTGIVSVDTSNNEVVAKDVKNLSTIPLLKKLTKSKKSHLTKS